MAGDFNARVGSGPEDFKTMYDRGDGESFKEAGLVAVQSAAPGNSSRGKLEPPSLGVLHEMGDCKGG